MPSFGSKFIFPCDGQVAETDLGDEFRTVIVESDGTETRNSKWQYSRMLINISGMQFTTQQRRLIRAFHRAVKGAAKTFLFRRGNDDEYEMQNELLGIGDGARTAFQCRVYDDFQGAPTQYIVRWLDHDYPPIGLNVYGEYSRPTQFISVTLNGVAQTLGTHYTVNRETGMITFLVAPPVGAEVRCSGGFYILVRCNDDRIPLKPMGSGWYEVPEGVALIEPKSGR